MVTDACSQVDILEQDAFKVLRRIRSLKNGISPINRIPPEVLALVPDFWEAYRREKDVIALTHVCRAWREVFTSRSSLWTDFYCTDIDKTRVYLKHSKLSPIEVWLDRRTSAPPRSLLPDHLPRYRSAQVPVCRGNTKKYARHHRPPNSPCPPSQIPTDRRWLRSRTKA